MSKKNHERLLILFFSFVFLLLLWAGLSWANQRFCITPEDASEIQFGPGRSLYSLASFLKEKTADEDTDPSLAPGSELQGLKAELLLPQELFDGEEPMLYVPVSQSGILVVNGEEHRPAAGSETIICPLRKCVVLPEEREESVHVRIELYFLAGMKPTIGNGLLYLGRESTVERLVSAGSFQRFFVIGISFMILLYSLSLYSEKRSEKYLLYLALLAYTTTARTLWNALPALKQMAIPNLLLLGTVQLPGLSASTSYYVSYLVLKLIIACMRFLLLREFTSVRLGRSSYFFYIQGLFLLLLPFCFAGYGYLASQIFLLVTYLLEFLALILGYRGVRKVSFILAAAWCCTIALRIGDLCYACGLAPHGMIEASLKLQGIIESFSTLAFVIVINLKFAHKYQEADELSLSLEEANRTLEKKVAARTKDLSERNAELSEAYRQLHELQLQKSEFMTNIIHSLKTPLFSLYGYADMAMDELEDAPELARRHLEEINKNTAYARQLIDNLFLSMRLEDGKVEYQPLPFHISLLLSQLESTSQAQADAGGITLHVIPPAEDVTVKADLLYLRQALQNIVDNAVRHSQSGTTITIQTDTTSFPGKAEKQLRIRIRDEGEGIASEELPRIFMRYYSRAGKSASSSGLGLTIAKEIIEQNGGHIAVESRLGEGTEFSIYLPRSEGTEID